MCLLTFNRWGLTVLAGALILLLCIGCGTSGGRRQAKIETPGEIGAHQTKENLTDINTRDSMR